MRIAVCCKALPVDVEPEQVELSGGYPRLPPGDLFLNEVDEYALEAGLALRAFGDAELWALTVGPLRAQEALYMALAKGVEHVLRVEADGEAPEMTAAALAAALSEIGPDLVLTGVQSSDWMGGQVGSYVAHALGLPVGYATVEILELREDCVRIRKEIGGGRKAEMRLRLPALLCIQSGIQPLQYVSALKRRKLRGTPVRCWGRIGEAEMPADLRSAMGARAVSVGAPESREHAEILSGERSETAAQVLEILRKNL